ncbi:asparagine synthase (glutamine-hydrolyzing) [Pseudomonas sp. C5pp]|uniref:asparagine synthase (glutamine-hydrolyzing) n=1 Tax=Pseudomonas sp. C5pp TaxID=1586081 RepID=UPI00057F20C2|nr:asparagine synthase (glutamine-hydrolyzing) [Pseudomonas sp. C5pp]KIC79620.1 asparagine synthase [Pseudomonas sp. C5pp]
MCGIAGFFSPGLPDASVLIGRMTTEITHRGPDDAGHWMDESVGLALGHRRLAILDLSPAGHQPMASACSRFIIVYNGEIYNHLDLRSKLEAQGCAPAWRGHSDTETLLAGIAAWGLEKTLQQSVGMFAIALWDRLEQTLSLARDRFGEKPLYYGWQGNSLLFGSELKALKYHPAATREVDRDALTLLLRHNCIPAPYSIYKGIHKLRAGYCVKFPLGQPDAARQAQPTAYWSLNEVVEQGLSNPFLGTFEEATDLLERQLSATVGEQMLSDVPLGAFLSGGVDSSSIVALMQAQSRQPVRTFTIGFGEAAYNEAGYAKEVARHLGTDHTELYVTPSDAQAVIPKLASIYCEPFSDSSQIPTFLVSQLASTHVRVALSGDGGDELFGGYNRYLMGNKVWSRLSRLPTIARKGASLALRSLSPAMWDQVYGVLKPAIPARLQIATPGDKAHKLAGLLGLADQREFFRTLTSHWQDPASLIIGATEPETLLSANAHWPTTDHFAHTMMAMDAQTYMTDDILVKVDRAAMAVSLESRVPMLDPRVVEMAWTLPLEYKIHDGQGKRVLREVLYRHVPRELIERPKQGFGLPLDSWLRGPLRDWAAAQLDPSRLRQEGIFRPEPIIQMWNEHLSGRRNWQHHLWNVLMFQAWYAEH